MKVVFCAESCCPAVHDCAHLACSLCVLHQAEHEYTFTMQETIVAVQAHALCRHDE